MTNSEVIVVNDAAQHLPAITPMQMLNTAVAQGADLDKLQKLMDLQERWEKNEARKAYQLAFSAFKAEAVMVVKNITIMDGPLKGKRYADLFGVVEAATPMLSKHGLTTTWKIVKNDKDWIEAECTLTHVAGHSESASFGGPPDAGGAKNAMQARASTLSYVERYTFLAVTGLAAGGTDDDGDGGSRKASAGALSSLPIKTQEAIVETATQVKALLANDQTMDAYALWQDSKFDTDETVAFWSLLNSKQRGALGRLGEAEKAQEKGTISPAKKKRLEARIGELKADRDYVKEWCKDQFNKEHFADLTNEEYSELDEWLDEYGDNKEPAPQQSPATARPGTDKPPMTATGSDSPLGQAASSVVSSAAGGGPDDAEIVKDVETWVRKHKFDMAYDLARSLKDEKLREETNARIKKAKDYVEAKGAA